MALCNYKKPTSLCMTLRFFLSNECVPCDIERHTYHCVRCPSHYSYNSDTPEHLDYNYLVFDNFCLFIRHLFRGVYTYKRSGYTH